MAVSAHSIIAGAIALGALAFPACASAQQKSGENAVTSADDAFGTSVGLESTGIYSQYDARGFGPLDAGNARIDGIYFDQVALVTQRVKASQAMRVGFAALEYPFPAPTGIVDDRLRTAGNDLSVGVGIHRQQYGSFTTEVDSQIPVLKDHLAIAAGMSQGNGVHVDGTTSQNYSLAFKPVGRFARIELSPFFSANYVRDSEARPLTLVDGISLPKIPAKGHYYGSPWAKNQTDNINYGATVKARITEPLYLRAGLFRSVVRRKRNFTEIFRKVTADPLADHYLIADPVQDLSSLSGEIQLFYRLGKDNWNHRLIAGFRGRDRSTDSGGSDTRYFGKVPFGEQDTDLEPEFHFTPVNVSKVRQTSWMLGYLGKFDGLGIVNLGIQRADFRGRSGGLTGPTVTREKHWLYNASLGIEITSHLTLYVGTQRGLEDSGDAPETAINRNEQLDPTLSTQYEAGLSWKFAHGQFVLSAFQITKPYFSYDANNFYTRLGTVRHRGIEASLSGHFIRKRLNLLIGAVAMDPVVFGPGRDAGILGKRPVGTRFIRARLDANYRTDLFAGFTPTLSVLYRGKAAASSFPHSDLGGRQLFVHPRTSVDVGFRQPIRLGRYPATIRGQVSEVLDQKRWLAIASNTLMPADRRHVTLDLLVDF
ncbi:MAG: TonB-dependent receptor [Novosphingobium sp.]|nr:TonB-dependent receptor [Novosphingobium sp.]